MPPTRKPDLAPEGVFGAQILYPSTPRGLEDLLFSELFDGRIPGNERWEYDTPHPDPKAWPHHVLVHVEPGRGQGQQTRWYAMVREKQDYYNFESAQADIRGTKFNLVIRHYVHRRDTEFKWEVPKQGDPMPNIPVDKFAPGVFILGESGQSKIDDPHLDSLFTAEKLVYIERTAFHDINSDKTLGVGVLKTTTLYYRGELVPGTSLKIEELVLQPANPFWGAQPDGSVMECEQVSDNWWVTVNTGSLEAALLAYKLIFPGKTNLNLPDVLLGIDVSWSGSSGDGNFNSEWGGINSWEPRLKPTGSLSGSESASAQASASIQPDLAVDIFQPTGRDIPSTSYYFYMKLVNGQITDADFLNRVALMAGQPVNSVKFFPTFKPVSHTIVLKGQKVSVAAQASASASQSVDAVMESDTVCTQGHVSKDVNEGSGTSFDSSITIGTMKIPPTIHPLITLTNPAPPVTEGTATCDVGWDGTGPADMEIDGTNFVFPSATASATRKATAVGSVHPLTLPPTTPDKIPDTGLYVVESSVQPYIPGWVHCYAEVVDASKI